MTRTTKAEPAQKSFSLLVDKIPYQIKAVPFNFNEEQRFYVSINGAPDNVFLWDSTLKRLRPVDDNSSTMPDGLEEAISQKLLSLINSRN